MPALMGFRGGTQAPTAFQKKNKSGSYLQIQILFQLEALHMFTMKRKIVV